MSTPSQGAVAYILAQIRRGSFISTPLQASTPAGSRKNEINHERILLL